MKYSLRTEHITLSDLDREQLDKKLSRLNKHLLEHHMIDISILHDTHHQKGNTVTCVINIEQGKKVFHAERTHSTIQNALDEALAAVARELKKEHDKNKRHGGGLQAK
jgi:ribosomal subunit interface protein